MMMGRQERTGTEKQPPNIPTSLDPCPTPFIALSSLSLLSIPPPPIIFLLFAFPPDICSLLPSFLVWAPCIRRHH